MDNPSRHPGQIPDESRTWPNCLFFWKGGKKTLPKRRKSRDLWLFTILCLFFDLQSFGTCYFWWKLIFRIFWIFHLLSVTSGTVLQNGVCERVVSKDRFLMYDPVWRFTCIQLPVIFFQITGLVFSFSGFKFLPSSLPVFFPLWGSRYFLNSGTSNQRARSSTHNYFPHWNVDPQRIFLVSETQWLD